jgi:two-component sensor histidine kinase
MTAKWISTPGPADLAALVLEHAPLPMAMLEGDTHIVRHINPAFCRLIEKPKGDLVGKPFREMLAETDECLALLEGVYRTGKPETHTAQAHSEPGSVFASYAMWPVIVDERTVAVMIQVIETVPLHDTTVAMNEALMLGSLRQHELAAAADASNIYLQTEIGERKQGEHDARMMTMEISHRIKNSLQIIVNLIGLEARRAAPLCVQGYTAMQARIGAIAELYDLISQSSRGQTVPVDTYLREIAKTMTASLLGDMSSIEIEVKAEPLDIDPNRAVPFGLLVNELATNAIKHAFPGGKGQVVLEVEHIDNEIELTVSDNGVGVQDQAPVNRPGKHGSDYVAIFVRQLGGTIVMSGSEGTGTSIRVRLPLLVVPQGMPGG